MASDYLTLFRENGALLEGHFGLTSGRHSPVYLQCALVLQYPAIARDLGSDLGRRVREILCLSGKEGIDLVVSPAVGGIVIGQEVAASLGARAIFSERVDGKMLFRRGFAIKPGEKVLAVEDVVTTGGSVRETADAAWAAGGHVMGTASIVHRYIDRPVNPTDLPHASLLQIHAPSFLPEDCPLCREGIPVEKPGSRHLLPRKGP
ncbi:MAG: orotate phosphoribosyltransferase [Proteobacteria bacterium]|nr:orotate phosphoribosyltransferase [Pseudomonadota bacterium]